MRKKVVMSNETEVSFYENVKNVRNGKKILLVQLLEDIKNGRWKEKIERVRKIKDKKERDKLKTEILPCVTISGTFSHRENRSLLKHSRKICMDFDGLTNVNQAKNNLRNDQFTLALFKSASGKGLAVIVQIDPEKHLESFLGLEKYYLDNYGYKIDESCKDVSRARYVSHDPELFINTHSKIFKDYIKEPKEKEKLKVETNKGREEIKQQVEYVINQIEDRSILIGEIETEEGHIKRQI